MAMPDAGTDTLNRGIGARGVTNRGVPNAGIPNPTPTPRAPTETARTLLVFTKGFDKTKVNLYNEAHFSSLATTKEVDSWPDVMDAISHYKSIDKLVFMLHSNPGTFLFGPDPTETRFRSSKPLRDAAKELTALPLKPRVRTIDLAGCNVGFDPDGMLQFGLSLDATEVIATNHFHEFALDRLNYPAGGSAKLEK